MRKHKKQNFIRAFCFLLVLLLLAGCTARFEEMENANDDGIWQLVRDAKKNATQVRSDPDEDDVYNLEPERPVERLYGDEMAVARRLIGLYDENMDALHEAQRGNPWYDSLNAADKLLYLEIYQILYSGSHEKIWLSSDNETTLYNVMQLVMTDHPELNIGFTDYSYFSAEESEGETYYFLKLPMPSGGPAPENQARIRKYIGLTEENMEGFYREQENRRYYQYLNADERLAYVEMIREHVMKPSETLLLTTDSFWTAINAWYAVRHDYPEYNYEYRVEYAYDYTRSRFYYWTVRNDEKSPAQQKREEEAAHQAALGFLAPMPKGLSDYETIKWIFDKLVLSVTYTLSLEEPEEEVRHRNTIAATLIERECICGGYAATMMYLLSLCGIECLNISGWTEITWDGYLDGYHAWNLVFLEGAWYELDACWADANNRDEYGIFHDYGFVDYTWFLFTTQDGRREDRIHDTEVADLPVAVNREGTYFSRNNLEITYFDKDALLRIAEEQLRKNGIIQLKAADDDIYLRIEEVLTDEETISTILNAQGYYRYLYIYRPGIRSFILKGGIY